MDGGGGCLDHLQAEPYPLLVQIRQTGQRRLVPRWAVQRDVQDMNLVAQGEIQAQSPAGRGVRAAVVQAKVGEGEPADLPVRPEQIPNAATRGQDQPAVAQRQT